MKRKAVALEFSALEIEGNLIAPAMLAAIDRREAGGQAEADYGIKKGLTIRDEIARYFRIGQALFLEFAGVEKPSAIATTRFVESLLRDVFGFEVVVRVGSRIADGHYYVLTLEALGGRVPVVVVPPHDDLDRASDTLFAEGRKRSAATALQDWLNHSEDALWGFASNGESLRLMRDNESLTRPAYIEASLRQIFEAEDFASFAAFWLLAHSSRFGQAASPATDCWLERWRDYGAKQGVAARDRLRDGVEAALKALGTGFLSDNSGLRERVSDGSLPLQHFFGELLRIVYRLIFLMAAEDRDLLHYPSAPLSTRRLYAEGYSLAALRERAVRRSAWDSHHDRWEGLSVVFRALDRGEKLLGLPALGGLFAPGEVPDLDEVKLSNKALLEAIYRLSWLVDGSTLQPVNWRDMETEELGSVYESLLELTPRISEDGRAFSFAEGAETKGNQRKTTGSYYTPDSLVQALLDTALDPVLDRVEAEADDPAEALASVTIIDPACGSGHFLLAAARRIATRVARHRAGGVASAADYRHALRDVVRRGVHGVDRNPMAVELTKVALWIETVEPGKPLGFLDTNIRCGDALLGLFNLGALRKGIPDAAYKPLTGDDKDTAKHFAARNKSEKQGQGSLYFGQGGGRLPAPPPLGRQVADVRALPEDTVDDVAQKAKRWAAAERDPRRWSWRIAADLYVAAFLTSKTGGVPENRVQVSIPTTGHVWQALASGQVYGPLVGHAQDIAGKARAFHWPLGFPDIFERGGFDVVLGNPPWERIKLQEQEFFAARDPEIAEAPNAAARGRLIAALARAEPGTRERNLHDEFEHAKRSAEATSMLARVHGEEGGRFPLTGRGDVNTYALFAELFSRLVGTRGRAGVIVPTGIATDATTAPFFAAMVEGERLIQLLDFENRAGLFPAVHTAMKFCLLTLGRDKGTARFAFFLTSPTQLAQAERNFTLTPTEIAAINPNTRTAPVFRSASDAELTARIYSNSMVFIDDSRSPPVNSWNADFHTRIWHMAEDADWFRSAEQLSNAGYFKIGTDWIFPSGSGQLRDAQQDRYVPLYEAKMCTIFDHRVAGYGKRGDDRGNRVLPETSIEEHLDPNFEPEPFYWVPESEVRSRLASKNWARQWLLGWRDITAVTNERTLITSVIPAVGNGNKILLVFPNCDPVFVAGLYANLASLSTDYVARQKVGGISLTLFTFRQLPVLPPSFYTEPRLAFVVPKVLELTYTSQALRHFARDLGYSGPPFAWDEDRRAWLRAELDAFYGRAYGLTRDELRYILDPADVKGPDYPSETFRVLKNNEIKKFGEYRTRRLVLEAWDRMDTAGDLQRVGN